jgi:hypothetical protein
MLRYCLEDIKCPILIRGTKQLYIYSSLHPPDYQYVLLEDLEGVKSIWFDICGISIIAIEVLQSGKYSLKIAYTNIERTILSTKTITLIVI